MIHFFHEWDILMTWLTSILTSYSVLEETVHLRDGMVLIMSQQSSNFHLNNYATADHRQHFILHNSDISYNSNPRYHSIHMVAQFVSFVSSMSSRSLALNQITSSSEISLRFQVDILWCWCHRPQILQIQRTTVWLVRSRHSISNWFMIKIIQFPGSCL